MDTNALKKFAQAARTLLIDQVTGKLAVVLAPSSAARREHPEAMKALEGAIASQGKAQVIEQVAYTWFNRFAALRFMDANGYTLPRVVSPADGATRPEILAEAMAGILPEKAPAAIAALLEGRIPSNDPQGEAYRLLLVHACNAWHQPMPFLFERFDDYSELLMPDDLLSPASILARMRDVLTEEACADVEVIGWIYQFYISEKKDEVFSGLKKNIKITAENIPAATQLFTPHWIVRYLVENSLGRLWLLNRPESKLAAQMDYYVAPQEPETDFLQIDRPEDICICDPASGSGHMLTYAFDLLYAIYEEEGYEPTEIPGLILSSNLHGVEIDDRAGALAAFALAMKAASRLGRRRFLRLGVQPKISVMEDVRFTAEDGPILADMVGRDLFTAELRETLGQFEQAKNFGSLIVPKLRDAAAVARTVRLKDFSGDLLLRDVQNRLLKALEMADALSPKYHVVVANPPYMGVGGMNDGMKGWSEANYPNSCTDAFSMFIERTGALNLPGGFSGMVTMQNWMFLSSFEQLREHLLSERTLRSLCQIGYNSFPEMNSKVAQAAAFVIENRRDAGRGAFFNLNDAPQSADKRLVFLRKKTASEYFTPNPEDFRNIPGSPLAYWATDGVYAAFKYGTLISSLASVGKGLDTGNNERFLRVWSEVPRQTSRWVPCQKGGPFRKWFGNNDIVIDWGDNGAELRRFPKANLRNSQNYFRAGISWTRVSSAPPAFRAFDAGQIFESTGPCVFADHIPSNVALGLLNSNFSRLVLGMLAPTLDFQSGHVARIPVPSNPNTLDGGPAEACVALSRRDWSAYETSWDFSMLPLLAPEYRDQTLAGSYARLRASWQDMTDQMWRMEEENNRVFIAAFGLEDELPPQVPLEEITLNCNPAYRYGSQTGAGELETRLRADTIAEFLHYAVGCMFGRYSLDAPGLILANQGEGLAEYLARVPKPSFDIDADNVIPVLEGEWFADDITGRFRKFLRVTFGEAKFRENLAFIEASLGRDVRKWFTKDFFDYHVRRYKKRPIYWMFSSPKGSFNALIYMHRYRPDTVSIVLNDYLREFISKLQAERGRLERLSGDPAASQTQQTRALKDVATVIKQIDELESWEREVVFPLAQAKIEIDLNDGVKWNYPKFGAALKPIKGLETADE